MEDDTREQATLEVEGFTPFAQMPRWVLRNPDLSHGAVRLYGVIMSYADNATRAAFPSQDRLADDMGVTTRSIRAYIRDLELCGALTSTRRRNRKTGNFYANHYVLRFSEPEPSPSEVGFLRREEVDVPITRTTEVTTSTIFPPPIPEESEHRDVAPPVSTSETRGTTPIDYSRAENADPIGPEWYHSDERQAAISWVATMAEATRIDDWGAVGIAASDFEAIICAALGLDRHDSAIEHLMWNRGWTPPKKAASKYEAAVWLNKFLYAAMEEEGGQLTFTPIPRAA